jgi:hypothetical protein
MVLNQNNQSLLDGIIKNGKKLLEDIKRFLNPPRPVPVPIPIKNPRSPHRQ